MAIAQAETVLAEVPENARRPLLTVEAAAGPTLVAHGADADLIVVGTRGRNAVTDTLLGSVSGYVVHHATVPAAVVPLGTVPAAIDGDVVVGVDGSANGVEALAWALTHSEAGETVIAVHAWTSAISVFDDRPPDPGGHFESAAQATLDDAVARATAQVGSFRGRLEPRLVEGDPRQVLAELVGPERILALGARGRHGLAHAVLGSVTTSLVHRPAGPTVVVPGSSSDD